MNKYDWSNVPKEVKWIASNETGYAHGFKLEPTKRCIHVGYWDCGGKSKLLLWPYENPFKGNWQDSLEERPSE